MNRPEYPMRLLPALAVMLAALLPGAIASGQSAPPVEAVEPADAARLPADQVTKHELSLPDRNLAFTATAGSIALTNPSNEPEADIAFVAYVIGDGDPARPVTFAINGGPGAASAYLNLGVLGPWRLPMGADRIVPSQPIDLVANPDTWLDFTDLVFIDPVGTGFSRLVNPDDALRGRYLSVDGDVEAIADFILRWLAKNGRTASSKYLVGESYGGFRGPLVAETLQTDYGVGLSGMTLLSPVLDFGWWQQPGYAPLPAVSLLPSLTAAAMEAAGAFSDERLRAAEEYAAGDYVTDLLRGPSDAAAVARIVERVTDFTGLDRRAVEHAAGRIDARSFGREVLRDDDRVISPYDPSVTIPDPSPEEANSRAADPVLDAMTAPLTSAMLDLYQRTLGWTPDRRYILLNQGISGAWDWGRGRDQPEAVSALRRVLALDPTFRLLVAHGYSDLVTPYFESDLILRQLPAFGSGARVRQANYQGGHMFYLRDASRRAFRADASALYAGEAG